MFPSRANRGGATIKPYDTMMPVESASIVVRKVPLSITKEQMEQLFLRAGAIKYVYFPKVPRHFTTKYCFIKFHDVKRARDAQQMFDGYRLGDQWLQVVAYDPTYKFRNSSQSLNLSSDDTTTNRTIHVSTSALPTLSTAHPVSGFSSDPNATSATTRNRPDSSATVAPDRNFGSGVYLSGFPSFLNQTPRVTDNLAKSDNGLFDDLAESDGEEENDTVGCQVVDNILLDSEIGFWTWLEQRLRFTGPLHYTMCEINSVLSKLPASVRQQQLAWPLGAFRLCDKERYQMFGPFICLPNQTIEAKAKCFALCCNWRTPFREFWEPMAPSEIRNAGQLIQYFRKFLMQFGPLRVDDMKIRQVLQCLSPEYLEQGESKLPSVSNFAQFLDSSDAKKAFGVAGNLLFLLSEHSHIFCTTSTGEIAQLKKKCAVKMLLEMT